MAELSSGPPRAFRPGRLWRLGRPVLAALLLGSFLTSACEVRRGAAPESTRQLQVAAVRRIADRPALSPAVWSPDGRALVYSSDHRLRVYTLDRGEQDIAPAEAVPALSWPGPLNLLALIDRGAVWTLSPDGTDRRSISLPGSAMELAWAPGGDKLAVVIRRTVEGQPRSELGLVSRGGGVRTQGTRGTPRRPMPDSPWIAPTLLLPCPLSSATPSLIAE